MVTGSGPTLLEKIASGAGSVAKLATAVAPVIAAINTEQKYYDETASVTAYGTNANPSLVCLTDGITQGTGDSNRIGNSILAKDFQYRVALSMPFTVNSATAVTGAHCRMLMFVWKYNDAAGPNVTKLLEAPNNIYSPVNKDYSDQFVVIKDKHFQMNLRVNPGTVTSATGDFKSIKVYKPLNFHMRWTDASAAVTSHIWVLFMSTASGVANALNATYYSRLNYTDN